MPSIPILMSARAVASPRATRAWALALGLALYVLWVTLTWRFPDRDGIPFPIVWALALTATAWAWKRWRGSIGGLEATAIVVVTAMLLTDVTFLWSQGMRDLVIYLKAGDHFLHGAPVYTDHVITARPADLTEYPFLYPPLTLPLFAVLSLLPFPITVALWTVASVAAVLIAFRLIGIERRWWLLLLAWPPVLQGLWVGNVALLLFVLFAAAPRIGGGLVASVAFKLYSAVTALWLVRERRWADLAAGLAVVVAAGAITAPLVPAGLWVDWIEGLGYYQRSQVALPDYLYGLGLGRWLPLVAVAGIGLLVIALALRGRDSRERLARLGLATIVASPSTFAHGFLVGLPSFLSLRTGLVWLVLGITACSPGLAWWLAPLLGVAAWFAPALGRMPGEDRWHPLGSNMRPWPVALVPEPVVSPTGGRRELPGGSVSAKPPQAWDPDGIDERLLPG